MLSHKASPPNAPVLAVTATACRRIVACEAALTVDVLWINCTNMALLHIRLTSKLWISASCELAWTICMMVYICLSILACLSF